jgi:long-subunit acyl-CoA synthetase (AMP-forming)
LQKAGHEKQSECRFHSSGNCQKCGIKRIEKEIDGINQHLGNWEQIKKIELTPEVWSIDAGLLTPTLKLKRKAIKEKLSIFTIRCMNIRNNNINRFF